MESASRGTNRGIALTWGSWSRRTSTPYRYEDIVSEWSGLDDMAPPQLRRDTHTNRTIRPKIWTHLYLWVYFMTRPAGMEKRHSPTVRMLRK